MSSAASETQILRGGTAIAIVRGDERRLLSLAELRRALDLAPWDWKQGFEPIREARLEGESLHVLQGDKDYVLDLQQGDTTQVLFGAGQLLTCTSSDLGSIEKGAVVHREGRILWVGKSEDLDRCGIDLKGAARTDLRGRLLTPGLVDCHAHPIFAGQRAGEFARRARGDHYLDIAREGGGIKATVGPTRAASIEEHIGLCGERMQRALRYGTTTMEAKSGYDLSASGELRLLEIAQMLDALQPVDLSPTLLGAHVLPEEYSEDRDGYVQLVIDAMIPRAASEGLASAVDVYCDEGAFTLGEMRRILEAAQAHGLAVKAHVGQFADLGGPELLAELGGLSADHLEQISPEGMRAMARSKVLAVMLPGACIQLKMEPPPVAALREAGVEFALASDLNPGTSHSESLSLPMWLATTHFGMSVEEAWLGVTRNAARAIERTDIGQLAVGARADFVAWDAELPAEIPYHFGVNLAAQVYKAGQLVS